MRFIFAFGKEQKINRLVIPKKNTHASYSKTGECRMSEC